MSFNGLRLEYALKGSSNYISWKDRMEVVLYDNGLKEFIDAEVLKPTDAAQVEAWQKKTSKCQRILLEGVKDHILSSLHGKDSPYLMWKALKIYFKASANRGSWRSTIYSETLSVRKETIFPSISRSSPNAGMSWEVWGWLSMMRTW